MTKAREQEQQQLQVKKKKSWFNAEKSRPEMKAQLQSFHSIQFQALIVEKKMEFERLRIQYESLLKTEAEQQEFIEQLILHC